MVLCRARIRLTVVHLLVGALLVEYAVGRESGAMLALRGSIVADFSDQPESLAVRRTLAILDRNGDSVVTVDDVRRFINETGLDPAMSKDFSQLDTNGDGILDVTELKTGLAKELLAVSVQPDAARAMPSSSKTVAEAHVPSPAKLVANVSKSDLAGIPKAGNFVSVHQPVQASPVLHGNAVQATTVSPKIAFGSGLGPLAKTALTAVASDFGKSGKHDQTHDKDTRKGFHGTFGGMRSSTNSRLTRVTASESKVNDYLNEVRQLEQVARDQATKAADGLASARASASEVSLIIDSLKGNGLD